MKALIIFTTMTGNTESIAESIMTGLEEGGFDVDMENVLDIEMNIINDYDLVVLGSPTWGEGELYDDMIDFNEELQEQELEKKKFAIFSLGDKSYDNFCTAGDILNESIESAGGELIGDILRIDENIDEHIQKAEDWGKEIAKKVK